MDITIEVDIIPFYYIINQHLHIKWEFNFFKDINDKLITNKFLKFAKSFKLFTR